MIYGAGVYEVVEKICENEVKLKMIRLEVQKSLGERIESMIERIFVQIMLGRSKVKHLVRLSKIF